MKRKTLIVLAIVGALLVTRCSLPIVLAKSSSEVVKILDDAKPKQICFESFLRAAVSSGTAIYYAFYRRYRIKYARPWYDSWLPEDSNDRILFHNAKQRKLELIYLRRRTLNIKFDGKDEMSKCLGSDEVFSIKHTKDMIYVEINKS